MSTDHRLPTPRFRLFMADGRELLVQAFNSDQLAYDRTAAKHHWPAAQDAPLTWATFVGWAAARRLGLIDGMTWEAFSETECLAVQTLTGATIGREDLPEGAELESPAEVVDDAADPTLPAAAAV
jgi:hypothetical protein